MFVFASGSNVIYCQPRKIASRVSSLLQVIAGSLGALGPGCEPLGALCLGGLFFSELLLIHPFADGNGRTSRILLWRFLRTRVHSSVALYVENDERRQYLKCLEERGNGPEPPWSVIRYLIARCLEDEAHLALGAPEAHK